MTELWVRILDFENYSISTYGAVRRADRFLTVQVNQFGLAYVSLHKEGKQHNRAVAPIVAGAFLNPPDHLTWNTPIHLDGNRSNLYYENLMWRPRWFASDYHQQVTQYIDLKDPIQDVDTGEKGTVRSLSMRYGLLPLRVYLQANNYTINGDRLTTVWPTGQMFKLI